MEQRRPVPRRWDPYRDSTKAPGNPQCSECRAIGIKGRWEPEAKARKKLGKRAPITEVTLCPACRQARDRYAQGVVKISAGEEDLKRILKTIENTEKVARYRNDQARILWISKDRGGNGTIRVHTTLPDFARHIGRELERTFRGDTSYKKSTEEPFMMVEWNANPGKRLRQKPRSKARRRRGQAHHAA